MQQRLLLQILLFAQHVSGTTMPIIRSSRVLYSGCCLWFSSCWSGVKLRVMCLVCRMLRSILQTGHITLSSTLENHRQQPLYNTLELLMMGIVVPETCWASNKICDKNLLHLVGILFPHIILHIYSTPTKLSCYIRYLWLWYRHYSHTSQHRSSMCASGKNDIMMSSDRGLWSPSCRITAHTAATTFSWLSITPLGLPVVPDV